MWNGQLPSFPPKSGPGVGLTDRQTNARQLLRRPSMQECQKARCTEYIQASELVTTSCTLASIGKIAVLDISDRKLGALYTV